MKLMQLAQAKLTEALKIMHDHACSYTRGDVTRSFTCILGNTQSKSIGSSEVVDRTRDMFCNRDDLGPLFPPESGDLLNIDGEPYIVSPLATGDCWRWSENSPAGNRRIRIHLRQNL